MDRFIKCVPLHAAHLTESKIVSLVSAGGSSANNPCTFRPVVGHRKIVGIIAMDKPYARWLPPFLSLVKKGHLRSKKAITSLNQRAARKPSMMSPKRVRLPTDSGCYMP